MVEKSEIINFNIRVPLALAEKVDKIVDRNLYKNRTDCVIDGLRHIVRTSEPSNKCQNETGHGQV